MPKYYNGHLSAGSGYHLAEHGAGEDQWGSVSGLRENIRQGHIGGGGYPQPPRGSRGHPHIPQAWGIDQDCSWISVILHKECASGVHEEEAVQAGQDRDTFQLEVGGDEDYGTRFPRWKT